MAEPYLSDLNQLIESISSVCEGMKDISCKHFFSGAAAYVDGHIFMSLSPVGLALKLAEDDCATLFKRGATPLKYFPKAPIKKGYAVLPAELVDDVDRLNKWVMQSLNFVRS